MIPLAPREATRRDRLIKAILVLSVISSQAWLLTCSVSAQTRPEVFEEATLGRLRVGESLIVVDSHRQVFHGRLTGISPGDLTITSSGKSTAFKEADVLRIDQEDSRENGAFLGLGFGIGILVVACKSITHREKCGYEVVLPYSLPVLGGGVAIGGIIDTLIHRTIYSKSAGNVLGRLVLEPSVGPGSAGALVAIRW